MANSLVKLTLESNQYEKGLRQAQKQWDQFTKGIGLSVSKFTAVGAAITAVSGALKVAKDAFFKNEQQLDEWGRTVEASKSLYSGFLNAINNGDISGFLSNINNITQAARDAYDALDELSTFNAFNQIQTQKARTGFTEAMAGFRMGEGSKESVQEAAKAYQDELRTRMEKEKEAYSQAVRKIAAERGVPWGNLEQALTGKYGDYEALKNTQPTGTKLKFIPGGMFGGSTAVEVPMAVTAQEKMGEALRQLNDTELKELQALGAQAQRTGEEIAQIDKQMARVLNTRTKESKTGGGGGGMKTTSIPKVNEITYASDSIAAQEVEVQRLTKLWREASEEMRDGYLQDLMKAKAHLEGMKLEKPKAIDPSTITGGGFANIGVPDVGAGLSDEVMEKIRQMQLGGNGVKQSWQNAAQAIGAVGSAMAGIQDPAAKIVGTIGQAIASIALGYAQATTQAASMGPWAWIAFAAAGLAQMISMISSIHSATGYAHGGLVDGSSYSGDNVPIMANAGEVVLTKAMQANLANQLEGGGMSGLGPSRISGEQIYITLNRYLKRSGQGELVTWG